MGLSRQVSLLLLSAALLLPTEARAITAPVLEAAVPYLFWSDPAALERPVHACAQPLPEVLAGPLAAAIDEHPDIHPSLPPSLRTREGLQGHLETILRDEQVGISTAATWGELLTSQARFSIAPAGTSPTAPDGLALLLELALWSQVGGLHSADLACAADALLALATVGMMARSSPLSVPVLLSGAALQGPAETAEEAREELALRSTRVRALGALLLEQPILDAASLREREGASPWSHAAVGVIEGLVHDSESFRTRLTTRTHELGGPAEAAAWPQVVEEALRQHRRAAAADTAELALSLLKPELISAYLEPAAGGPEALLRPEKLADDGGRESMGELLRATARALQPGATAVRFAAELSGRLPRRAVNGLPDPSGQAVPQHPLEDSLLQRVAEQLVPQPRSWLELYLPADQLERDNIMRSPHTLLQRGMPLLLGLSGLLSLLLLVRAFWPLPKE